MRKKAATLLCVAAVGAGGLLLSIGPADAHTHCGTPQAEEDCPTTTSSSSSTSTTEPTTTSTAPTTTTRPTTTTEPKVVALAPVAAAVPSAPHTAG